MDTMIPANAIAVPAPRGGGDDDDAPDESDGDPLVRAAVSAWR